MEGHPVAAPPQRTGGHRSGSRTRSLTPSMPIPRNVAPLTTVAHSWLIHGTDERRRGQQVNVGGGGKGDKDQCSNPVDECSPPPTAARSRLDVGRLRKRGRWNSPPRRRRGRRRRGGFRWSPRTPTREVNSREEAREAEDGGSGSPPGSQQGRAEGATVAARGGATGVDGKSLPTYETFFGGRGGATGVNELALSNVRNPHCGFRTQ